MAAVEVLVLSGLALSASVAKAFWDLVIKPRLGKKYQITIPRKDGSTLTMRVDADKSDKEQYEIIRKLLEEGLNGTQQNKRS